MTSPLPDALSFAEAAVLPLGITTAASALFQRDFLAMNPPVAAPASAGQTLLVWGGSTGVGVNAIQLAVAAGYRVVATGSPRNFDTVKRLGAEAVFDYRSPTVATDLLRASHGRRMAGAIGSLDDLDTLRSAASDADAVIHLAFNHDFSRFEENSAQDRRAIGTLGDALKGSDKILLVTSGVALLAPGRVATEADVPTPDPSYPRRPKKRPACWRTAGCTQRPCGSRHRSMAWARSTASSRY